MAISSALGSSALLPAGLGFRNVLINGNFDVWQRGTSFTDIATTAFSADRAYTSFAGFLARCTVTQNTSVPNARSKYSIRFQQPFYNSNTLTDYAYRQYVEGSNAQSLYGRVATLSFWYKSSKTGSHAVRIDGSYATGGSNFTTTFTVSAVDTWEYKVITTGVPFAGVSANNVTPTSAGAMVSVGFCVASGVGFSAVSENDYFQISQLQLEANSQPTPFEQRPVGIELALCHRYFQRMTDPAGSGVTSGVGIAARVLLPLYTRMRATPTSVLSGTINFWNGASAASCTSINTVYNSISHGQIDFNVTIGTQGQAISLYTTGGSQYIDFSAEL